MTQLKTHLFATCILGVTLNLSGCDSSSDSDDTSNGGNGSCSGQVNLVSSGSGLNSDAGYEGLHFFGFHNQLCALNPQTGELFMVDEDTENTILEPAVTVFDGGSGTEDLTIAGVAYANNQKVRFATSNPSAQKQTETLVEVSSGNVDVLRLGRDRQNWENSMLLYRTVESGSTRWHSVQLNGNNAFSFADGKVPLGPVHDSATGKLEAWLVHSTDNNTTFKVDLQGDSTATNGNLNNLVGVIFPAYLAQLATGKILFAEPTANSTTKIRVYDPNANSFSDIGTLNFELNAFGVGVYYLANDDELYLAAQKSDSEENATLWRITDSSAEQLDTSGVEDTWPQFIQLTAQGVAWGWAKNGGGGYGVSALDSDDTKTTLFEGSNENAHIVLSTPISGADHNWVFFNFTDLDGPPMTFEAYAIKANDATNQVVHEEAQWHLASSPASASYQHGHLVPERVSERFLSKHEGGQELVYAASTATPEQTHLMGELSVSINNPFGMPQALLSTPPGVGLGPYRLFTITDSLWLVDSRHEDSLTRILQDSNEPPSLRTFTGF